MAKENRNMLPAIVILQLVILLTLAALFLRRPPTADPRLAQLPDQLTRVDTRAEALDAHTRESLAQLRADFGTQAAANSHAAAALRTEVLQSISTLSATLNSGLDNFRIDNKNSAESLRVAVLQSLESLAQRLSGFIADTSRHHADAHATLHTRLNDLTATNTAHQDRIRITVETTLTKLNTDNAARLEEMRVTVDEKLNATLHTRLTESFGQVTDQLNKVHSGLGEMSKLSEGVDDLSRIFTNVKARGGFAEVQLDLLLQQMLAPSQFVRNVRVKPHTLESIEFAVRFPGHSGETLLPIDSKFPREDWERLEAAYNANDPALLAAAGKAFETAIRTQARLISEKYINPPVTTPHAIMFLPTEGLYAEVMRRDALQAEIQSKFQVTIAGPSTLSAILTSFQMGFHMLALQEKGDEVWRVLEAAKTEFGKFGILMDKVERQVGTVQNTLREIHGKTTTINRTLRDVSDTSAQPMLALEDYAAPGLRLVASEEEPPAAASA